MNVYMLILRIKHNDEDASYSFIGVYSTPELVRTARKEYMELEDIELPLRYGQGGFRTLKFKLDAMPD